MPAGTVIGQGTVIDVGDQAELGTYDGATFTVVIVQSSLSETD